MKKNICLVLVCTTILLLSSCGGTANNSTSSSVASEAEKKIRETQELLDKSNNELQGIYDLSSYDFIDVSFDDMESEQDANSIRAKEKYQDMYIHAIGYVNDTYGNGLYVTKTQSGKLRNYFKCLAIGETLTNAIDNLSRGDKVEIWGQITSFDYKKELKLMGVNKIVPDTIEYIDVDLRSIYDLSFNSATEKYDDAYIKCKGKIYGIKENYFTLKAEAVIQVSDYMNCMYGEDLRDIVINKNNGDDCTIYGHIKRIEMIGVGLVYNVDVLAME